MWDKTKNEKFSVGTFIGNCPRTLPLSIDGSKAIGPSPDELADYIDSHINGRAKKCNYYDF